MSTKTGEELIRALKEINKHLQFKDAHLELVSGDSSESLFKFLEEHFFPDEVTTKSIDLVVDQSVKLIVKQLLRENLSILLISDISGEIIACRGITIGKRGKSVGVSQLKNAQLKIMFNSIIPENEKDAIYDIHHIDRCLQFLFLVTHRDYRRQGLATKMMQAGLMFCPHIGLGPVYIKGEATSNFSQKIYEKHGFEIMRTYRYDECKKDGEIVFKNTDKHKTLKVYFKKL